jgi:hypothetical protein
MKMSDSKLHLSPVASLVTIREYGPVEDLELPLC